ncbi:MAG: hypothetical protein IT480_04855 [Gammaproteobacteria bacterium]|nr:hypothetical protein [Gammaproteobacteria bacterium]
MLRADAERLDALDDEYRRALGEMLRAQTAYTETRASHAEDDPMTRAALFRLWHAQQRQQELRVELDALHH